MKTKVQCHKQQQSCKRKFLLYRSKDTIEISSGSFVFNSHKIYYFKLFCWQRMCWKQTKLEHNKNWFCKLSLPNGLQAIVMLISWIAWVRSLCTTFVQVKGDFLGWFLGCKRSTYTQVNMVTYIVLWTILLLNNSLHWLG